MTKIKAVILGAVLVGGAAITLSIQHKDQVQTSEENRALRAQIEQLTAENDRLSNQVAQASSTEQPPAGEERELLRLRGEVGNLRRELAQAAKAVDKRPTKAAPSEPASITPEEEQKQASIAKMNYAKGWVMAFVMYAQQHQGHFPGNLEQAEPFLGNEFKTEHGLAPDQFPPGTPKYGLTPDRFEILYQDSLESLKKPQNIIVLREKDSWQTLDGGWVRTYGFADGHCELHKAVDGNFEPWEAQHVPGAPPVEAGQ